MLSYGSSTDQPAHHVLLPAQLQGGQPGVDRRADRALSCATTACVIYLNGVEVVRSNMPAGTVELHDARDDGHRRRRRKRVAARRRSIRPCSSPARTWSRWRFISSRRRAPTSASISSCARRRRRRRLRRSPSRRRPTRRVEHRGRSRSPPRSRRQPACRAPRLYVGGPPQTAVFTGPLQVEDAQITADTPTTPTGAALPSISTARRRMRTA